MGNSGQRQRFLTYNCLQTEVFEHKNKRKQLVIEPLKLPWPADKGMEAPCWVHHSMSARVSEKHFVYHSRYPHPSFVSLPPSLLPPLPWYVTELIVKTDYTCIIKAGPSPPFVPSSDQQDHYCSTGEHIWTVEPKLGGRTSETAHSQCCRNATHWPELWKDPMLGSGHIWISLSVENSAHLPPLSVPPPRTSAKAGSQDPLITAHQGNDIIAHWQGYLRGDREILEG